MKLFVLSVLFFFFFLSATSPYQNDHSKMHVWNIGQGQWVTFVHDQYCEHYDMGGERAPWGEILQVCQRKKNILFLSHWDWDHMSFVEKFKMKVKDFCLFELPDGPTSAHKKKLLQNIPICAADQNIKAKIIDQGNLTSKATNNDRSNVVVANGFLLPGDSTIKEEKRWAKKMNNIPIQILVLGHHGSRTSTSDELLWNLNKVKMAIASSRQKKYGHPHAEVVAKLKKFRIPLIRTEDWGSLHFSID